jgi:hypothetical protein
VGRWVLQSFYFCQVGLLNCWRPIFLVLPKLDDAKLVCQTAKDALNTFQEQTDSLRWDSNSVVHIWWFWNTIFLQVLWDPVQTRLEH